MWRQLSIGWSSCLLLAKHPPKDLVHIPQRALQVERAFQSLAFHLRSDLRIVHDELAEVQVFFPGSHGIRLHQPVSVLAKNAALTRAGSKRSAETSPPVDSRFFSIRFG